MVAVNKEQTTAVIIDITKSCASNIRKEYEKLEKYQGRKENLENIWKVKAIIFPVVIGALRAVTPKLEEWLYQIVGTTSDICPELRDSENS